MPRQRSAADVAPATVSTKAWQPRLIRSLFALDVVLAGIAGVLALFVRFGEESTPTYRLLTLAFPVAFVAMIAASRGYESRYLGSGTEEYRRVADAGFRLLALSATVAFALR